MTRAVHLLFLLTLSLRFCGTASYFPNLKDLAEGSPIRSSSTCGRTTTKYCDSLSLGSGKTCKEKECHFGCCPTCATSSPTSYDLKKRGNPQNIFNGQPRPGKSEYSSEFDSKRNSKITVSRLPSIEHEKQGFTICVWVNQTTGNAGTIFSKSSLDPPLVIYGIVLDDFSIKFYYIPKGSNKTEHIQVDPLASQYPSDPMNNWHFICVMAFNTQLSYFLDGKYVGTDVALKNSINEAAGTITVGQTYPGASKYDGLMQDIYFYNKALTNREVTEAFTGNFPKTYISSQCRCPPSHPKISIRFPAKCVKNSDQTESKNLVSRLSDTSHPIEFAADHDSVSYWLSEITNQTTNQVTIDIDLRYGQLQVFHIISEFYGPLPGAILIERSTDRGQTYRPWQYFAADCVKSFGMQNNGNIKEPDSVNCLQYIRPYKTNSATITFRADNPGEKDVPLRPYGVPGCNKLYCSPKLLYFIKATNVRLHFYNHTLSAARYFGLYRLIVSGRCECFGHAKTARYIPGNTTNNGSCVCQCHSSTNTEGDQCNRCKLLYNNKPFRRGDLLNPYPCVKCECHGHADRCYYNATLDKYPSDRSKGGGGVCLGCLHNTAGQRCETCQEKFYRDPTKPLDDPKVCIPCGCSGPGVKPGAQDCVKDNSDPGILPGQCQCKDNVTGRSCDQCKPGFYDLSSSHASGCISCNCDTRGTIGGNVTCDVSTGQCECKVNVTGRRCDQCKANSYNLARDNPNGCQPCRCNITGSTSSVCDKVSGRCPCRATVTGQQCDQCQLGYHSLNSSGCTPCSCSSLGTPTAALQRCDPVGGKCQCKIYVTGYSCDRCMPGYYNLRKDNSRGCTRCQCDSKGTVGNTNECDSLNGGCTCKSNVTGANCDSCPAGFFNLSMSNPDGCEPCLCYPKGTRDGNTKKPEQLNCDGTTGQCQCRSNVRGVKCDECVPGYVWDQTGQGCIACNCHPDGSLSRACNDTGYCDCKPDKGIGGQFCDRCLLGYHSFNKGSCTKCNCNLDGVKRNECDAQGCLFCKDLVEGKLCDKCKPGTKNLRPDNPFGCSGVPSEQGPPIVQPLTSRILRVTWDPPDRPNGLITSYVLYRNGSQVYSNTSREFNDTGLRPYTTYAYYIITHTDGGSVRSLADGKVYRTLQDVPSGVAPPNLTDILPRTAKAVWSRPITPNGVIRNYYLESTNRVDSGIQEHCRGLFLNCDVTRLRPYTVYNFTIRVCTDAGCTRSEANRVLTRPTAPDSQPAPVVVPLPGGKRFSVSWDEPSEPNGVIFRYEVYQRSYPSRTDDRGGVVFTFSPSANPGQSRNVTIGGLVPFTWYGYRVVTYTAEIGGDTASNWTRQRTAEAAPEGERSIRPQSFAISSSEVNISWQLPSAPYGIIVRSNVFVYTNETSYSTPTLVIAVSGSSSAVVSGLQSYSVYEFSVTSCNSVGCTKHSPKTRTRTMASAPSGQQAPTGYPLNSTHLRLTWTLPAKPNGPLPLDYDVLRSHAAFHYPPINAIDGAHFPGFGYYRLNKNVIPGGIETYIDFWFKTWYSDGLLLFLASDGNQDDFLAVELRSGLPRFIFDCGTGPAEVTVISSPTFNDDKWHHVKITRDRREGRISVDDIYKGSVTSPAGSTVINDNTGVYVGGISSGFKPVKELTDSIPSVKDRKHFIGCLRNLRLQNKRVNYKDAVEKVGVDSLSNGCPLDVDRGIYLRGGGFFSLKKGVLKASHHAGYRLAFDFRTHFTSGLLLFTYGEKLSEGYLALVLDSGDIRILYQSACCHENFSVSPKTSICDGQWHHFEFTNFGGARSSFVVDGDTTLANPIRIFNDSSELYFGGVPSWSPASAKLEEIGLKTGTPFGGCVKNIRTHREIILLTDVASVRNADFSGCPKNVSLNTSDTCRNVTSTLVYSGRNEYLYDTKLDPFTDYLYRVESKQPGTKGSGKSPWFAVRSGEGAPVFRKPPHQVEPLDGGKSVRVSWSPPEIHNGILRGYVVRAYNMGNSSVRPVETTNNNVSTLNITLGGLDPYTVYDVRVTAFTNGGFGESPGTKVTTLESVPENVLSPEAHRFPYSLVVFWRSPLKPNGVITNYSLIVDGREVYRGLNRTFNLTGLSVFSRHQLKLTACTTIGCADSSTKIICTAEIPPENVSAPGVVIRDAHSADVRWREPGTNNGIMRGYQVVWTRRDVPGAHVAVYNATVSEFNVTIMNLTAGTWYSFSIVAINGGGATRSATTSRRTVESSPEDIPPPDIRGLSPYSILVTIREPRLPNGNITRYELFEVVGPNEILVLNGTSKNYTKTGLLPYAAYYFRSKACTAKGCGSSKIGKGFTLETAPNGSVILNISILNAASVLATWSTIHTPNGIVSYGLVVHGVFLVQNTSSCETENATRVVSSVVHPRHEILYTSLLPYTSFTFQINASNTVGFVLSNVVDGRTGEGAPICLAAPNVTILNSTAVRVSWSAPARDNGILLHYEIMSVNLQNNMSKNINNILEMSIVLTDFEPYTKYQFRVAASTKGGRSWSPGTIATTHEDIPDPIDPPTIPPSKVDSRSLVVAWDHPTKPNGIVTRYIVYRNHSYEAEVASNVTTLTVTNLEPFTIYTFSVAVCTVVGCSNSSMSRPVRTLEDVPEGQSPPVLSHVSGPSVLIRWSAPTVTNGKISEYKIQRRSESDRSAISSVATVAANSSTEYVDRTVKPCTLYHYRVIAFTSRGGGTPSLWRNITTQEGAPDVVPRPATRTVNSSAIHVTWSIATSQCNLTGYIIRVLNNGRNYSGFGTTGSYNFIVGDLLPYTNYSIVVAGCTSTACRDSPPSFARTHSSLPRDQPPPTAVALDSTSLRVTWGDPKVPAGRIVQFRLFRRTLDEPLSDNFTTPPYYVLIYQGSGIGHSFVDKGLGIFSAQQYKVMVVNTDGNTTSNDSQPFRTGPIPPRAGVLLSGRAVNHTSILLNWTLPELKLLLGYVVSYEVHFRDLSTNIEYTYMSDLNGAATRVVVNPLKPSRDYSLRVILNNGAGNFPSNDVRVRTLDGAPEGFNKPNVRTINSTTIEVTWMEPSTPNGRITTYVVYANSSRVANTSGLSFNITSLIPFTVYVIQVEVCTVYACVRSDPNSARTLPAAPDLLDPPRLIPGRRNMMVVWNHPRRPNGRMLEYKLFRRRLEACPTSPAPVKYCTYIECPLAEQLCGTTCYSPRTKVCCNGVLHDRDPSKTCCDDKYLTKTSPNDVCCSGRFYPLRLNYQCCHGFYKLVKPGQVCCLNSFGSVVVGNGNTCCGQTPYFNNTKYCVCGTLYDDPIQQCCGGNVVSSARVCCGGTESDGRAYDLDVGKKCCGADYVPLSSLCCKSVLGTWKVYNYSSVAQLQASGDQCCGTNKISSGMSCCNDRGYNATSHVCADRATSTKTGCGTGIICNKSSEKSAMCNRCDFKQNSFFCGHVDGYYTPVSPTPPREDCGNKSVQIGSGNGEFRSYNDRGLKPFTIYEYYLVARNTEGNITSSKSRNTTLMDAPEGIAPPIVTVLSSSSVEIRFSPPRTPNGIISEYRVTRVDQNSSTSTLVYNGSKLSYNDTDLQPVTGYIYILEVCTSICSNVSSRNTVYTMEAIPEDVHPPVLRALNSSSIEVRWRRPGKPNGIIIDYIISRINASNHTQARWNGSGSHMVLVDASDDLKPYTNYSYVVTACTKIGCSTGPRALVTTLEAAPEGLEPPELIKRSAHSIEANWKEPNTPNGVIIWYALYRDDKLIYNGTDHCRVSKKSTVTCRYQDFGLSPHTRYNYTVEASTAAGSTKSDVSSVQTPESTPEGIPIPSLIPQSASSILVTWTVPDRPNGAITNYSVMVDTVNEKPAGLLTRLVVTGLQPYTWSTFQVQACTIEGCGVGNRSRARTNEAPPQGQPAPRLVALSGAVVRVTWSPPSVFNGIITSYEVERRLISSVPVVVFKTISDDRFKYQTLNSGLLPYRNYSYRIRAINSAGSTRGPWAVVRTLEGAPSGLYAPVVHVLNSTAVTASWQSPRETNGHITGYELWTRDLNNPGNKFRVAESRQPEQNVTVSGLKPNTNYEFQLAAKTVGGKGYSQWVLAETLEAPPLGLRPLSATKHANGRELTLTWEEPSQPNGAITNYILYSDGEKVYSGVTRECHLRRLDPYTNYTFQLEACTPAGCTKGPTQVITTAEIPPQQLGAPSLTSNSSSVTIQWKPPTLPHGEITKYQVLRTDRQYPVHNSTDTSSLMYTDHNLQPFTKYEYKIRAQNSAGSIESSPASIKTAQAAPEFVKVPRLTPRGSSSVDVSWDSPSKPNGNLISFTLRRNDTVVGHWNSPSVLPLTYNDTTVNPDTSYSYWLTVCTGGGCTDSDKAIVRTGESRPGVVKAPTLTVYSSIAIKVEWQPPVISNGVVTSYKIYMNGEEQNETQLLFLVVNKLAPFTTYTFNVSACTGSGCTPGEPSSATTHEAAPEGLARPTYSILGPRALEIKWKRPDKPNGVIKYYLLRRNDTVIYNGTELRFNDIQILPYTYYGYDVTVVNSAGEVKSGSLYTNRTSPGTPENVTKPTLKTLNGSSIRVSWTAPAKPNGIIKEYLVLYNKIQVNVGVKMSYVARNLDYYTVYSFRIRACTSMPPCADSAESSARTDQGPPSGQSKPAFSQVKARSVFLEWGPPSSPNGVIIKYLLDRRLVLGNTIKTVYNGSSLKFTDNRLQPFQKYQYRITGVNSAGQAASAWTDEFTTDSAPPENVPLPTVGDVTAVSLDVSINPPAKPNGIITDYKVELIGVNVSSGTSTKRKIGNLEPYTEYTIRVFACTVAGCTPSGNITRKTETGPPGKVEEISFGEVTSTSIHIMWKPPSKPNGVLSRYLVVYKFVCSEDCIRKRAVSDNALDVGLDTSATITGLQPYTVYRIVIQVENNKKQRSDSAPVEKRTMASDPKYVRKPVVNVTGNAIVIDWSKSFSLNGPLLHYVLYENEVMIFRGTSKNSGSLPDRTESEFVYVVSATTNVNGDEKTVQTLPFSINISGVSRQTGGESSPWYRTIWFIAVISVLVILAVFGVVALCLRRTSGDRTVYIRERDPLPVRPKSRSAPMSRSSNYTPSEAQFNLAEFNPDIHSRASTIIGEPEKINRFDDGSEWEGYIPNTGPYGNTEWYDDDKTWTDDDEPDADRSIKYQVFTDTHL